MGVEGMNKAVVYAKPGTTETEVQILEIPEPAADQILVRMQVFSFLNSAGSWVKTLNMRCGNECSC
jgi:NADPH:quinone reductase-like Zn-dependent oxidoreductase